MNSEQVSIETEKENIKLSKEMEALMEEFNNLSTNEEKIRLTLSSMKNAISQDGNPDFKLFWDARRLCLPLFKEALNPAVRLQFWGEYIELSQEARRLKDLLDEQTSFTLEQIDLAIASIEKDLENYDDLLKQIKNVDFPHNCESLQHNEEFYLNIQQELNLLNTFAAKINSLRKEIMKTNMRIRSKNNFFQRLSSAGDKIFPKRKDYIREISQEFMKDIDSFVGESFDVTKAPYYVLREEIKCLQNVAKVFTLNTQAFTSSRLKLSECWDLIKLAEKEYKKEMADKKNVHQDNKDQVQKMIKAFSQRCTSGISIEEANSQTDEILSFMKSVELKNPDIRLLKQDLFDAKSLIVDKEKNEKKSIEQKIKTKKKEKLKELSETITSLLGNKELSADALDQEKENFEKEISELKDLSQKNSFENNLKTLEDLIADKREEELLSNAQDDLEPLKEVFEIKKKRRALIKQEIEGYRKELAGSGFDFEKAMLLSERVDLQKKRLDEIDRNIDELEEKIAEMESE